jgi:sterol desaturase/sphingolipid hydroxylase (fatty acid hydroxylase superfamily)
MHPSITHAVIALSVSLAVFASFCFCGWLLERAFSVDKSVTGKGVLFNCCYMVFFTALNVTGGVYLTKSISAFVARAPFHGFLSSAIEHNGFLPVSLSLIVGSLLVGDFFYYWFHRLQHSSEWLWAQHELHHSDEHVNVTTSGRHHWLEIPLVCLFVTAPMGLLFNPSQVTTALAILVFQMPGYFIHLNSHIRFGAVGRIFACPQTHRVHHSIEPRHFDQNFAAVFSLWDSLFGTYYHPAKDEWPETGLASGKTVRSLPYALVMPFVTWSEMLRRRRRERVHAIIQLRNVTETSPE